VTNKHLQAINRKLDRILHLLGELPQTPEERDTVPAPPVRTTWLSVGLAYREKLIDAREGEILDYYPAQHRNTWEDLARVLDCYAEPKVDLQRALSNFFGDSWVQSKGFPPSVLLRQFEKYRSHCAPVVKREDEPDAEAINAKRLRERQERELQAQLDGHSKSASKPPPLDELLGKIGKTV